MTIKQYEIELSCEIPVRVSCTVSLSVRPEQKLIINPPDRAQEGFPAQAEDFEIVSWKLEEDDESIKAVLLEKIEDMDNGDILDKIEPPSHCPEIELVSELYKFGDVPMPCGLNSNYSEKKD